MKKIADDNDWGRRRRRGLLSVLCTSEFSCQMAVIAMGRLRRSV